MKNIAIVAIALASLFAFASVSEAGGGGGAKQSSKVKIVNQSNEPIGVLVDYNGPEITSQEDLVNRGGKIINPGNSATFEVSAGTRKVRIYDENGQVPGSPFTVNVTKGKTVTRTYNGNNMN